MTGLSRRDLLALGVASCVSHIQAAEIAPTDLHQTILTLADGQERERRAHFAAVRSKGELEQLQQGLRRTFLDLIGGLPRATGAPPSKSHGRIDADGYTIEKVAYESFPNYVVPGLLYRPKGYAGRRPAVLSPCGHSTNGKAADTYQILHINLAKRGFIVLTYDPVGQGERSQFWDAAKSRSHFNLSCGEHCVLGNPLYLLGTSLARYRIWDGIRGIDLLASLPDVDPDKIGCAGNSGGGTLTAYISALDPRVRAAVISCYITTLPRRMANRIQEDPDSDPEQDIYRFVSAGIDHAGLLALRTPRPTLVASARHDFFPLAGAIESVAEVKKHYKLAGAGQQLHQVVADAKHGLSLTLRQAAYGWFERWLNDSPDVSPRPEIGVTPRSDQELRVCPDGQVNLSLRSRHLLHLAYEEFKPRNGGTRDALLKLLDLNLKNAHDGSTPIGSIDKPAAQIFVCVNGNETGDWRNERAAIGALSGAGYGIAVVDPRGVQSSRIGLRIRSRAYEDPLNGVEENLAYNAFLAGQSLLGLRVAGTIAACRKLREQYAARRLVLCGRRDAAFVALLAAAVEPSISALVLDETLLSFRLLFEPNGYPINAASILPGLLRDFGDVEDVMALLGTRPIRVSAARGSVRKALPALTLADKPLLEDMASLQSWLAK